MTWLKEKLKRFKKIIIGVVIGGTALASGLVYGDLTKDKVSLEKLTAKYEQATEIKAEYSLSNASLIKTDVKNRELDKYTGEFKDEVKVEIGEVKIISTPIAFGLFGAKDEQVIEPTIKLSRWNEVDFKISPILDAKVSDRKMFFDKNKIIFKTPKMDFEIYSVVEGEGGVKYIWYLNEKPATNKVEFQIESSGLDFFYQPELTAEEIAQGASRPENVVGSYAVYHSTKGGMNDINGKEYKTGKAFHIYRPHIIDATGAETWGILNIENGIYSVEIPQDFLDTCKFPIRSNDTFGYETPGGSSFSAYSVVRGSLFTGAAGVTTKITAYTSVASHAVAAIYLHSTLALIDGSTDTSCGATAAWNDFLNVDATISAVGYVLVLLQTSGVAPQFYYDTGDADQGHVQSYPFPWPDPMSPTHTTEKHSIYATYTPAGGGAAVPEVQQFLWEE